MAQRLQSCAVTMVSMQQAIEQGQSGQQTIEKAKQMDLACSQPELERFVKNYVDQYQCENQSEKE